MDLDDDDRPKRRSFEAAKLAPLSIAELEAYIGELEGEIARARTEIAAKTRQRGTADSIFRS
jgi:uncharacterized small protein (DUF1192 family)